MYEIQVDQNNNNYINRNHLEWSNANSVRSLCSLHVVINDNYYFNDEKVERFT